MISLGEEMMVLSCYEVHQIWSYLKANKHYSVMDFFRQQFPLWESVFHQVKEQFRQVDLEIVSASPPMDAFQCAAASNFLSEWPKDMDYTTLIYCLRNEEIEDIIIWEPFEDYSGEYIAGCMNNQLVALTDAFIPKTA